MASLGEEALGNHLAGAGDRVQAGKKDIAATPQNPLTAYAFFFKETHATLKSQKPDTTFEEVSAIVEAMWRTLDDGVKKTYEEKSLEDKRRFQREMEAYRAAQGNQPAPAAAVVPPSTASLTATSSQSVTGDSICIRLGCGKPSVRNLEWEDEYCSNQCVVLHCDYVFRDWVREQANKSG